MRAGFGNFFNGYLWTLGSHDGWLYAGTYDWSVMLRWGSPRETAPKVVRFFELLDREIVIANGGGADLSAQPGRRELDAGHPAVLRQPL